MANAQQGARRDVFAPITEGIGGVYCFEKCKGTMTEKEFIGNMKVMIDEVILPFVREQVKTEVRTQEARLKRSLNTLFEKMYLPLNSHDDEKTI